jgi:hypothetical protein
MLLLQGNDTLSSHKVRVIANRWWSNAVTSVLIEILEVLAKIRHFIFLLLSLNKLLNITLLICEVLLARLIVHGDL